MSKEHVSSRSRIPANRHAISMPGIFLMLLVASLACASVHASDYRIEATPAWIAPVAPLALDKPLLAQISDGTAYLLSDTQTRITPDNRERYRRIVSAAVSAVGVQHVANIEIGFDPSYETLVLHSINIVRDGQVIPKAASANVRVLQREPELERRILDGGKTASIFLDDVRVGDTVDYAYSVHGRNPVFKGQDSGYFALQFGVPIGRIHARIVAMGMPQITFATTHSDAEPAIEEHAGMRIYRWDQSNVAARTGDSDTPTWHDADAGVQWSTFRNWAEVAQWGVPLYAPPAKLSRELEREIARIARDHSSTEARALAVLRFVQDEIRYLGVLIGEGSHAPNPPDVVLERRFGDCKDKTLLMLTMLDRLGIESQPALVHTSVRRGLATRIASPTQFDHVLVHARIDGRSVWLDPTRSIQHSDLAHLVQADFDLALLVDAGSTGLSSMKPETPAVSKRLIRTDFDARDGFDHPVSMTVTSEMDGMRAESMRATLASSSPAELAKSFLNFYANYYPGIAIAAAMEVEDDQKNNRLVTTEYYTITEFPEPIANSERLTASFHAPEVSEVMSAPKAAVRSSPLALAHPTDVKLITEVLLPEEWPIKAETITVDDPGFEFERTVAYEPERLQITHHYRSLADEISAADTPRFAANQSRARELTSFTLSWGPEADASAQPTGIDRFNGLLIMIAVMALAFWIWLAFRLYRYDPSPASEVQSSAPVGLRGWLALPTLGVVVTPCLLLFTLISEGELWTAHTWSTLTTFGSTAYHPLWAPIVLFSVIAQLGLIVYSLMVAIVYFQRRTSAPHLYIGLLIAAALTTLTGTFLPSLIPSVELESKEVAGSIRSAITSLLWIAYFLKSQRVKATFRTQLQRVDNPVPVSSAPLMPLVP